MSRVAWAVNKILLVVVLWSKFLHAIGVESPHKAHRGPSGSSGQNSWAVLPFTYLDKFAHVGDEGYAHLYEILQAEVNTHICALGQVGLQARSGQGSAALTLVLTLLLSGFRHHWQP